jgi:hypothetical protein
VKESEEKRNGINFRSAVKLLERWLKQYETLQARGKTTPPSR